MLEIVVFVCSYSTAPVKTCKVRNTYIIFNYDRHLLSLMFVILQVFFYNASFSYTMLVVMSLKVKYKNKQTNKQTKKNEEEEEAQKSGNLFLPSFLNIKIKEDHLWNFTENDS